MTAPRRSEASSPLRIPVFRNFWLAITASNLGVQVQIVAAAWLMTGMTRSPHLVALVQTAVALPVALFVLVGGAIADSVDRRRVMLAAQSFVLAVSVVLVALIVSGLIGPYSLLLFVFLVGAGGAVSNPAWHASTRDLVPRTAISAAVALNSMGFNLARAVGPAIGGLLVALGGSAVAVCVSLAGYLWLIAVLRAWRPAWDAPVLPREALASALVAGLRYAVRTAHVRSAMLASLMTCLPGCAIFALLPILVQQRLGGGSILYGALLGACGMGAVLGAAVGVRLRGRMTAASVIAVANVVHLIGLVMLGLSTAVPPAFVGAVLGGMGWVIANTTINTTVQIATPRWVSGRTLALVQAIAFGSMAGGSWLFGLVADRIDVVPSIGLAGAIFAFGVPILARLDLPGIDAVDIEPAGSPARPPDLGLAPGDGPLVVETVYRVRVQEAAAFHRLIAEQRRISRRDGALGWSLMHDLSDRERWIERYSVRSWEQYLRYGSRRTVDDARRVAGLADYQEAASFYRHAD